MVSIWTRRVAASLLGVSLAFGTIAASGMWAAWTEPLPHTCPPHAWTGSPEELDVLEAALRYLFSHNSANPEAFEAATWVFVGVQGHDGVEDLPGLRARFEDLRTLEPASAATLGFDAPRHTARGGEGVLFLIWDLQRIDDSTVEVELEYQGGCYARYRHRFSWREGSWTWVGGGMQAIS